MVKEVNNLPHEKLSFGFNQHFELKVSMLLARTAFGLYFWFAGYVILKRVLGQVSRNFGKMHVWLILDIAKFERLKTLSLKVKFGGNVVAGSACVIIKIDFHGEQFLLEEFLLIKVYDTWILHQA